MYNEIARLLAELEKEQKLVKCSILCRCEDPYSASRKQVARECVAICTQYADLPAGYALGKIQEKFRLEQG